jgi:GH25 family lysozyme M1 (1,4-beta-N-acetylmuramidase)
MAQTPKVVTVSLPKPKQVIPLGKPLQIKGTSTTEAVRVELFADKFHLQTLAPLNGQWSFIQPQLSQGGVRILHAVAFDAGGKRLGSMDVEVVVAKVQEMGTDVSDFNPDVNWNEVRKAGFSFAFAKSTEGSNFVASSFSKHWKGIQTAGLVRGTYHFFRPTTDARAQADLFLSVLEQNGGLETTDLPPVLDLEHFPSSVRFQWESLSLDARVRAVRTWVDRVESQTKRKVMFYTSFGFWSSFMPGIQDFVDQPLWIANFTERETPFIPDEWEQAGKTWTFWQFTESGSVPGVNSSAEDVDRFNGGLDKMLEFIDSTIL